MTLSWLPRSLLSAAGAPDFGASEKAGLSDPFGFAQGGQERPRGTVETAKAVASPPHSKIRAARLRRQALREQEKLGTPPVVGK